MNLELLKNKVKEYMAHRHMDPEEYAERDAERRAHADHILRWGKQEIQSLDKEGLYKFISPLWAMLIWGNKQYVVDKLVEDNGLKPLRHQLANLIWGTSSLAERWDDFRSKVKGIGPAMMSEILCHHYPQECPIWNKRARAGLEYLGAEHLPKYDYQSTGERYEEIGVCMQAVAKELQRQGMRDADLLAADYFIWDHLQPGPPPPPPPPEPGEAGRSLHNDVRDKIAEIGRWLGFTASVETKVADGSRVDAIWNTSIGNMGRVIYVFEVQTKGNIDGLIVNLLKSLNNPAVQGVVAVSDSQQLEKIKRHAAGVNGLRGKLKFWNYDEVFSAHSALEGANEVINKLGLVSEGFTVS